MEPVGRSHVACHAVMVDEGRRPPAPNYKKELAAQET
jgi:hypothetical protein